MYYGNFDDGIWDEHQWERHLNEIEKRSNQLRKFISSDPSENIPRWLTLLSENSDKLDALDAFIEEELQFGEAYFPGDIEDPDDDWDDELDDIFTDEFDDLDAGEEWKELSPDYTLSEYGSLESLKLYQDARELAVQMLNWAESTHPKYHTRPYNDFIDNILQIGAKLAGGYSFGFDQEFLGGNIAYAKKALHCANEGLHILQDHIKEAPYIDRERYAEIHMRLFELRNAIGIYIQELRERFHRGFE